MSATIDVLTVSPQDKRLHRQFIQFPHRLYAESDKWVPFFNTDMRAFLTRKHPYYQNYPAEFFIAQRDGQTVGTLSVSSNNRYMETHDLQAAHFFFYDVIDDLAVSQALFDKGVEWARAHGAKHILGPILNGLATGSGLLIEGFEYPAMMTMMRYNFPYYLKHLTELGFKKYADLNSYCSEAGNTAKNDPRIDRLVEIVKKRGHFRLHTCKNKKHVRELGKQVFDRFLNELIGDYPENYPLPPNEQQQMIKDVVLIVRPELMLYVTCDGEMAGYGMGFPDITKSIQKSKGRVNPVSIIRMLRNIKHADSYACNGIGVLPEYQGRGGNVLVYAAAYNLIAKLKPRYLEYTQIGENTKMIANEMKMFFNKKNKIHRMLIKDI